MLKLVIGWNSNPYMTRWYLLKNLFGKYSVYLHHIHRPDRDKRLHDHPHLWGFSIILRGSYIEERLDYEDPVFGPQIIRRRRRWFNRLRYTDYHRIDALCGDVWTLFITKRHPLKHWGFVHWLRNPIDGMWSKYYEPFKTGSRPHDPSDERLAESWTGVRETGSQQ